MGFIENAVVEIGRAVLSSPKKRVDKKYEHQMNQWPIWLQVSFWIFGLLFLIVFWGVVILIVFYASET